MANYFRVYETVMKGNKVVDDISFSYSASSAINTQNESIISKPENTVQEYAIIIKNTSTVTDLTVKLFAVEKSLGGADEDILIQSFTVPKTQALQGKTVKGYAVFVHGLFCASDLKIVVSNNSVDTSAFNTYIRIKEVG